MIWRFGISGVLWTLSIYLVVIDRNTLDASIVALWGVINIWHAIEENRRTQHYEERKSNRKS